MKPFSTLSAVLLAILAAPVSAGDAPTSIRVATYNVQFLPGPGKLFNQRGNDDYRAVEIGKKMADYDIVGFNEVFELGPRTKILAELKSAWGESFHAYECPEPAKEVRRYNAGLAIASRFPIVETHHIPYSQWSTIKQFGVFADEFAQKGAIHARVRIPTSPKPLEIDVFATHLDSKLATVRKTQIDELADFAAKYAGPANPAIFLGDFNTRGNERYQKDPESAYAGLVARLRTLRPKAVDVWVEIGKGDGGTSEQTGKDGGSRIDYIFLAPPTDGPNRLRPTQIAVQPFLDKRVVALSDHSAVIAEFGIEP